MLAMYRQAKANGPGKLTSFLDARKIDAAVGKRTEERSQAAVMGNYSATDIAGGLGWPTTKLETGFAAAEKAATRPLLSMVAYSIAYSVQLETTSYILGTFGRSRTLHRFYPCQRPFFYTAESELDNLVRQSLISFGWMHICTLISENYPEIVIEYGSPESYRDQVWSEAIRKEVK
ncbi:hypothetical protein ACJ41O_005558 [Fusarium nematophilum]